MLQPSERALRARLTGVMATMSPPDVASFEALRRQLEHNNTHFNGAAEQLCRIEAALRFMHYVPLPLPRTVHQNENCSIGLSFEGLFVLLTNEMIAWRFAQQGEPRFVLDAATAGVPVELLNALAHLSRLQQVAAQA